MSQNHHLPLSECAAFTPLLPLASHDLLGEEKATMVRQGKGVAKRNASTRTGGGCASSISPLV